MSRTSLLVIACLASLWASAASHAQPPRVNGADHYWKAFEKYEAFRQTPDDELIREFVSNPRAGLTPEVRTALDRARPILESLRRGASAESVDFGIDLSDGPYTLLPHLNPMRGGMLLMMADARARLEAGDSRGAADAFAAGMRMSDHATDNPVLINTLVGAAMFKLGNNTLRQIIGEGELGQAEAATVLDAVRSVATSDPLGFVGALEGERTGFGQWMIDNLSGEGGKERFLGELAGIMDADPLAREIVGMTQNEFVASLHQYDLVMAKVIEAASQDDLDQARRDVAAIARDAENGVYGPVAQGMLPSLERVMDVMIQVYGEMDLLLRDLERLSVDPEAAAKLRNAALWYLRAIDLHGTLDEAGWQAIEQFVSMPGGEASETVSTALTKARPILDILHEAVTINSCNFDLQSSWDAQGPYLRLSHLPGMKRNAQLMAASGMALQQKSGDENQEAWKRVVGAAEACITMARHVATDERVASVFASADMAEVAGNLLAATVEQTPSRGVGSESLVAAINRSLADRLGLGPTLGKYRRMTSGWAVRRWMAIDKADGLITGLEELAADVGVLVPRAELEKLTAREILDSIRHADDVLGPIVEAYRTHGAVEGDEVRRREREAYVTLGHPGAVLDVFLGQVPQATARVEAVTARLREILEVLR